MPDPTSVIGVGGSVLGGLIGSGASGAAARASADASRAGVAENRRQFDTVLNLQAPSIQTGNVARSTLASILGLTVPEFSYSANAPQSLSGGLLGAVKQRALERKAQAASSSGGGVTLSQPASSPMNQEEINAILERFPGYRFAVDQAVQSAKGVGSATGSLGGNVLTALGDRVGGGIAMPVFNQYLDRLANLSGASQNATNAVSQGALTTGQNVAAGLQAAGDARASGILGQANSIGGAISGIGQILGSRTTQPVNNPYGYSVSY